MKWTTGNPAHSSRGGFTLLEVLVALAIAGGALVLILSANNSSLRRSGEARTEADLESRLEAKFEEILLGLEKAARGNLREMPGWRWEATKANVRVGNLKGLGKLSIALLRPDGTRAAERTVLVYEGLTGSR